MRNIGLQLNDAKTAYLTTAPALASCLPGTNANAEGLKILGRIFRLEENTAQEITNRIGIGLSKYGSLRKILRANTPIEHRLRIYRACIGQAVLWECETWHLTRRNLQRLRGFELKIMRSMIPPPPEHRAQTTTEKIEAHQAHIRKILREKKHLTLDRTWLKRFYGWAGHVSRLPEERWAKKLLKFKSVSWWRHQQGLERGHRHTKRRGNVSRWENAIVRYHPRHENWQPTAADRIEWPKYFERFEKAIFGKNCPTISILRTMCDRIKIRKSPGLLGIGGDRDPVGTLWIEIKIRGTGI